MEVLRYIRSSESGVISCKRVLGREAHRGWEHVTKHQRQAHANKKVGAAPGKGPPSAFCRMHRKQASPEVCTGFGA